MGPIEVVVRRGSVVEARHRVHAVAWRDGAVVEQAGDPRLVSFLRSSSKPIQALPLARARDDLDLRELAIACASHQAEPAQLDAVRTAARPRTGARAGARVRDPGRQAARTAPPQLLGQARRDARALPRPWVAIGGVSATRRTAFSARSPRRMRRPPEWTRTPCPTAVDGCGVVTFALSLERTAVAFSRFQGLAGGERIVEAMRAHPELIGGAGQADTDLMRALPGWIAKGGAEGLMCAAGPDGLGVALKAEDGSHRPTRPALHAFFRLLGLELPGEFARVPVPNAHGEDVGEVVSVL